MMLPSLCSATFPLSLLVLLILFISSSSAHSFHDDGQSLLAFKSLITIDPHQSMANWNPAVPFCNWTAVTCSPRHPNRVVALNLTGVDLRGTISPSLGNLSFLQWLDLSKNALYGHIPPQLGRLFRLRMLSLRLNQLDGSIPVELGYLGHLQFLYLGTNNLTECGLGERVSTQGDVYSYGILLLEMFTRKRPSNDMFAGDLNLHKWVDLAFPNRVKEVIESGLLNDEVEEYQIEENDVYKCLQSLLHIGLLCSKHSPKERPTMREVSTMLERLKKDLVENTIAPWRFRQSIPSLIASTSTTLHNVVASNDQSSTF